MLFVPYIAGYGDDASQVRELCAGGLEVFEPRASMIKSTLRRRGRGASARPP